MTTQEAYEAIRAYFSQPDAEYCVDEHEERCVYRRADGRKCAVGCLIPDDAYMPEFDRVGYSPAQIKRAIPELRSVSEEFLVKAQNAHDERAFVSGEPDVSIFIEVLDSLARRYNLRVVQ
jgi:hypothetical protein